MKSWRTTVVITLTLGLAMTPLAVGADKEEGSGGGHEAHETKGKHTHDGMKKEAKSKEEAKKAGASDEGASAEHHHHDGHGVHEGGHEGMEEGSH